MNIPCIRAAYQGVKDLTHHNLQAFDTAGRFAKVAILAKTFFASLLLLSLGMLIPPLSKWILSEVTAAQAVRDEEAVQVRQALVTARVLIGQAALEALRRDASHEVLLRSVAEQIYGRSAPQQDFERLFARLQEVMPHLPAKLHARIRQEMEDDFEACKRAWERSQSDSFYRNGASEALTRELCNRLNPIWKKLNLSPPGLSYAALQRDWFRFGWVDGRNLVSASDSPWRFHGPNFYEMLQEASERPLGLSAYRMGGKDLSLPSDEREAENFASHPSPPLRTMLAYRVMARCAPQWQQMNLGALSLDGCARLLDYAEITMPILALLCNANLNYFPGEARNLLTS